MNRDEDRPDTHVLSALWSNEPSVPTIVNSLANARRDGAVLISGVVYCELLAYPGATESFVNAFCVDTGITIDREMQDSAWIEAGRRFANYAARRRKSKAATSKRLVADFLIGAHALLQGDRLMSLDPTRYRHDFPELQLYQL